MNVIKFVVKLLFIFFITIVLGIFIHELVHCVQFNVPVTNMRLALSNDAVAYVMVEGERAVKYNSNPNYYENEAQTYSLFFTSIIEVILILIMFRRRI